MKQSIKWHKECLVNSKGYLARMKDELQRLLTRVTELEEGTAFYEQQIQRAEKEGRDGFDSEKFGHSTRAGRKKS